MKSYNWMKSKKYSSPDIVWYKNEMWNMKKLFFCSYEYLIGVHG